MGDAVIIAEPDRRLTAYLVDRALGWALGVGAGATVWWLVDDALWPALGAGAATLLVVGLVLAVMVGLTGRTPGRALAGTELVDARTGRPIGVPRSLLRALVVGTGTLPTFGFGIAALAWTALEDTSGQRRGWHDHLFGSVAIDARPLPEPEVEVVEQPRHVVNLTAMKLVPVRAPALPPGGAPVVATARQVPPQPQPGRPQSGQQQGARQPAPAPGGAPAAGRADGQGPVPPTTPPGGLHEAPPPGGPRADAAPRTVPPTPPRDPATNQPPAAAAAPASVAGAGPANGPAASGATPGPEVPRATGTGPTATGPTVTGPTATRPVRDLKDEATASRPAPAGRRIANKWRVTFDSGESFVVEGLTLVGRAPTPRTGEEAHHVVPLQSQDMSISKTHAQFHVASDGALVVADRGSTNGSILVRKGVSRELPAGRATTLVHDDRVVFGDRSMHVTKEG